MIFDMSTAEEKIGYVFSDKMLLRQAFTHSSYINEHNGQSNERMEFLGDSILNFVIAEELYKLYEQYDEGLLSMTRSKIVSSEPLAECILQCELNKELLVSEGEKRNIDSKSISENLFEAIVAAIYLDSGLDNARAFILRFLGKKVATSQPSEELQNINFKSKISEFIQKNSMSASYVLDRTSGEKHKPIFHVTCTLSNGFGGKGTGHTKKLAEQNAAMQVYKILQKKKLLQDNKNTNTKKESKK